MEEKTGPADSRPTLVDQPTDDASAEKAPAAAPPRPTYPEGGRDGWLTVLGAWFYLFSSFGYVNAFGVFEDYYLTAFPDKTASDIAWIVSLQLFLQFAGGAVAGPLFDKGYFRSVTLFGGVTFVFSLMMTSIAKTYWQALLAQGVVGGIGLSCLFVPPISAVRHFFLRRSALAAGIVVTGSSVGGIIFPVLLNNLIQNGTSFGWAVRDSAFLVLGTIVAGQVFMRTRYSELGIKKKVPIDKAAIFKDSMFIVPTCGLFFVALGVFYGFFYVQIFSQSQGIDPSLSFYTLAILNAASVAGRTLPNVTADIFGPFNLLLVCTPVTGILCLVLPTATTPARIIVWSIFYGFFSGSYVSLIAPAFFTTARSPAEIGARLGLPFLFLAVAALVGTPICGALLGNGDPANYPWWHASAFAGASILLGSAILVVARFIQASRKGTQKV